MDRSASFSERPLYRRTSLPDHEAAAKAALAKFESSRFAFRARLARLDALQQDAGSDQVENQGSDSHHAKARSEAFERHAQEEVRRSAAYEAVAQDVLRESEGRAAAERQLRQLSELQERSVQHMAFVEAECKAQETEWESAMHRARSEMAELQEERSTALRFAVEHKSAEAQSEIAELEEARSHAMRLVLEHQSLEEQQEGREAAHIELKSELAKALQQMASLRAECSEAHLAAKLESEQLAADERSLSEAQQRLANEAASLQERYREFEEARQAEIRSGLTGSMVVPQAAVNHLGHQAEELPPVRPGKRESGFASSADEAAALHPDESKLPIHVLAQNASSMSHPVAHGSEDADSEQKLIDDGSSDNLAGNGSQLTQVGSVDHANNGLTSLSLLPAGGAVARESLHHRSIQPKSIPRHTTGHHVMQSLPFLEPEFADDLGATLGRTSLKRSQSQHHYQQRHTSSQSTRASSHSSRLSSRAGSLMLPENSRKHTLQGSRAFSRSTLHSPSPAGLAIKETDPSRSPRPSSVSSEECGACLSMGILQAVKLPVSDICHRTQDGQFVPAVFKECRVLTLSYEAEDRVIDFEFDVVAPEVFKDLRYHAYGVEEGEYQESMCLHPLTGGQQGEGRSGMLFFSSWDKRYLAKTVRGVELPFFFDSLDVYHRHLRGMSAAYTRTGCTASLLPRFSGFYGLKFAGEAKSYLVVFENIFPAKVSLKEKYDLKGVLGKSRYVSDEQRTQGVEVLKDRNFVTRSLNVGPEMKKRLVGQLQQDVLFLEEHGKLDYSLLLGVADLDALPRAPHDDRALQWPTLECRGVRSMGSDGHAANEVFFFGIIDILQEYTSKKAVENTLKSVKHGLTHAFKRSDHADSWNAVSSVPPGQYAKRFLDYLSLKME